MKKLEELGKRGREMSADEIRELVYTLKVWREECGVHPVHIWDAHVEMESALLAYAATVERANKRRGMFAANYGRIDYECDSAIVDEIDYILRGDDGKEEK